MKLLGFVKVDVGAEDDATRRGSGLGGCLKAMLLFRKGNQKREIFYSFTSGSHNMNAQSLLKEMKKRLPFGATGKGPVIELFRAMGQFVDKKTALQVSDAYRDNESGEIVCMVSVDGGEKVTAALTNLKLDISHPLFNMVRNYRRDVEGAMSSPETVDVNAAGFKMGNLYKRI